MPVCAHLHRVSLHLPASLSLFHFHIPFVPFSSPRTLASSEVQSLFSISILHSFWTWRIWKIPHSKPSRQHSCFLESQSSEVFDVPGTFRKPVLYSCSDCSVFNSRWVFLCQMCLLLLLITMQITSEYTELLWVSRL